ncbi:MAG: ankyrin repeat domain-containing protein [Spirochaetota bacterium]
MTIAAIGSREDTKQLVPILRVLKDLGIPAYGLSFTEDWISLERKKIQRYVEEAGHYIIVSDAHSLSSTWFGFTVGNAAALIHGCSLYRVDPSWEPPTYLRGFPVFEDLDELRAFFTLKHGEWDAEEARLVSRSALLELGISCTADSLSSSVADGDIHAVELFLESGFNSSARDRHGVPLICLATRHRHLGVVKLLLERGAAINERSEDRGYTALMEAAKSGPAEQVAYFLDQGSDPEIESKDGQTALVIAVGRQDLESCRLLLEHGADPDRADKLGMSARTYAKLFKLAAFKELFDSYPLIEPE